MAPCPTKAFKDWFGDWERKSELSFAATHTGWKQTQNVLHQLKGVALTNIEKGIVGYVNRDQRNELSSPAKARISANNGFSTTEHYVAAQHIRELFKHATFCGSYNDDVGHKDLELLRFVCPFRYDGALCYAFITAKRSLGGQDANETKVYNLELMDTIRLDGKLRDKAKYAKEPNPSSKGIVARIKGASKTYFENSSKVVDENGEPLVVYHGTCRGDFIAGAINIRRQTLIKSKGFRFLRVKGAKLKVLCNGRNIIQLRRAVPFSKALLLKAASLKLRGKFFYLFPIFNGLQIP